jgi:hypothetical protein
MSHAASSATCRECFAMPTRWRYCFSNGPFDAVIYQFDVMFFPDKEKSCREVYRGAGGISCLRLRAGAECVCEPTEVC